MSCVAGSGTRNVRQFVRPSKFYLNLKSGLKFNYIIPFIFSRLGADIPKDAEPIVTFSFNILILSLIILFCFVNIIGYFISIYLINKYNVEERYPKYSKLIRYFEKSRIFFVVFEGLMCISILLFMIVFSLIEMGLPFFK